MDTEKRLSPLDFFEVGDLLELEFMIEGFGMFCSNMIKKITSIKNCVVFDGFDLDKHVINKRSQHVFERATYQRI